MGEFIWGIVGFTWFSSDRSSWMQASTPRVLWDLWMMIRLVVVRVGILKSWMHVWCHSQTLRPDKFSGNSLLCLEHQRRSLSKRGELISSHRPYWTGSIQISCEARSTKKHVEHTTAHCQQFLLPNAGHLWSPLRVVHKCVLGTSGSTFWHLNTFTPSIPYRSVQLNKVSIKIKG